MINYLIAHVFKVMKSENRYIGLYRARFESFDVRAAGDDGQLSIVDNHLRLSIIGVVPSHASPLI